MDCIFCKIARGEIPSNKVYEDDDMLAFHDINPMAKVHVLVIPKKHIANVDDIDESNVEAVSKIFVKIGDIAQKAGITNGYRVISNCGPDAKQSVMHLRFHILGGQELPDKMA